MATKRRAPAPRRPRAAATPWHEDPVAIEKLATRLLDRAYEGAGAQSNSRLFPGGITQVKLSVSGGATGFSFDMDVNGPAGGALGRSRAMEEGTRQLTPTALWRFIKVGASNPFLEVVSLGPTNLSTTPSFPWDADREHWFILNSIGTLAANPNLKEILDGSSLDVSIHHKSESTPLQKLIDEANVLADTDEWRFQAKPKGKLGSKDWQSGIPPMGSGLKYFLAASGSEAARPRLLLELTTDKKNFKRITWLTEETFESYEEDFTLVPAELPTDWTGWYHYTTATGH